MIDKTLINTLKVMANQEKKIKEYKRRIRLKGKVAAKGMTKEGNISLSIEKDREADKFTVLKTHKESFALACFFAHLVKEVVTYDIREDFIKIVEKNISMLGLKNITVRKQNIYDGIHENENDAAFDVVSLDLPEPWKVLPHISQALKIGGFLVSYSPTIPQVQDFVNAVHEHERLVHLKTIEIIQREWDVEGRKVRPKSIGIGHSGFLSFVRLI